MKVSIKQTADFIDSAAILADAQQTIRDALNKVEDLPDGFNRSVWDAITEVARMGGVFEEMQLTIRG